MKHIKLIAAAALLMGAMPASAADWVYVGTSTSGSDQYFDADTIVRVGNQITVWEKWDHSRDKKIKERARKVRTKYDCVGRTSTNLHSIIYYPDGTNRSVAFATYEQETTPIAPETMAEVTLEAVCAATTR